MKRRRISAGPCEESDPELSATPSKGVATSLLPIVVNFTSPDTTKPLLSFLFNSSTNAASAPPLRSTAIWSLADRAVQLLSTLLADSTYHTQVTQASDDPTGMTAVYGRLVQQVVEFMLAAAATVTTHGKGTVAQEGAVLGNAKGTLVGLQQVLMKVCVFVCGINGFAILYGSKLGLI